LALVFGAAMVAKSFSGKSGLFSIFMILCLAVIMGLFFAILPKVKDNSSPEDIARARLFAIIASIFGLLLLVIVIIRYIFKFAKASKQKKEIKGGIEQSLTSSVTETINDIF
jgi:Mg2+/Co2+ transporter CorB